VFDAAFLIAAKTVDASSTCSAAEKEMIRAMLSDRCARYSQTLCKTKEERARGGTRPGDRHPAIVTRSATKVAQMSSIQTGGALGMQTLDQNLRTSWRNLVSIPEARSKAANKDTFVGA
jgi:twitching motility protein PilT